MVVHESDGLGSDASIVVESYSKDDDFPTKPGIQIDEGPDWLEISETKLKGKRAVHENVYTAEYEVRFAVDAGKLADARSGNPSGDGTIILSFGDGERMKLPIQYKIVSHNPRFYPAFVSFEDIAVGETISRSIRLTNVKSAKELKFVCTPDCFSAVVELEAADVVSNRSGDGAIPIRISFSPAEPGVSKGEVAVERSADSKRISVVNVRGKGIVPESNSTE